MTWAGESSLCWPNSVTIKFSKALFCHQECRETSACPSAGLQTPDKALQNWPKACTSQVR